MGDMDYYLGFIPAQLELTKLFFSILVGGVIGIEREYKGKAAGFRTIIMICVGSTLFTIFSIQLGGSASPDRMAANIITGIGFLGAGAIFRDLNNFTRGLNTATIIWITAALGVGIGTGHFILVILITVVMLIILIGFPHVERAISRNHHVRVYKITFVSNELVSVLEKCFMEFELEAIKKNFIKQNDKIVCIWCVSGNENNHSLLVDRLFLVGGILEFEF